MILPFYEFIKKSSGIGFVYSRAIKYKRAHLFWYNTIGQNLFSLEFLESVCQDVGAYQIVDNKKIMVDVSGNSILGVLMFSQPGIKPRMEKACGLWEINLLAETHKCDRYGVSKGLIQWLEGQRRIDGFPVYRIVLMDDIECPNYYTGQGYRRVCSKRLYWLLHYGLGISDNSIRVLYYKRLSEYRRFENGQKARCCCIGPCGWWVRWNRRWNRWSRKRQEGREKREKIAERKRRIENLKIEII